MIWNSNTLKSCYFVAVFVGENPRYDDDDAEMELSWANQEDLTWQEVPVTAWIFRAEKETNRENSSILTLSPDHHDDADDDADDDGDGYVIVGPTYLKSIATGKMSQVFVSVAEIYLPTTRIPNS